MILQEIVFIWGFKRRDKFGYGSVGGTRAHETHRLILGELQVADVRTAVTFSLMSDFENMSVFKPADYHADNTNAMLDQVLAWSGALKNVRYN
jgi:NAD(P)H-dependent FMN reductase